MRAYHRIKDKGEDVGVDTTAIEKMLEYSIKKPLKGMDVSQKQHPSMLIQP